MKGILKKSSNKLGIFFRKHYKLGCFISANLLIVSGIAMIYSKLISLLAVVFGFSLLSFVRLITYRKGKIPFFMSDKTWDSYRLKYEGEELEKKYEEMSIGRATDYFIISVVAFIVWIVAEVLMLF
jgi:hypothetical protein